MAWWALNTHSIACPEFGAGVLFFVLFDISTRNLIIIISYWVYKNRMGPISWVIFFRNPGITNMYFTQGKQHKDDWNNQVPWLCLCDWKQDPCVRPFLLHWIQGSGIRSNCLHSKAALIKQENMTSAPKNSRENLFSLDIQFLTEKMFHGMFWWSKYFLRRYLDV